MQGEVLKDCQQKIAYLSEMHEGFRGEMIELQKKRLWLVDKLRGLNELQIDLKKLKDEIDEKDQKIFEQEAQIDLLKKQSEPLQSQYNQAQNNRETARQEANKVESVKNKSLNMLQDKYKELKDLVEKVDAYNNDHEQRAKLKQNYDAIQHQLSAKQNQLAKERDKEQKFDADIETLKKQLRDLRNNFSYRVKRHEFQQHTENIAKLTAQLRSLQNQSGVERGTYEELLHEKKLREQESIAISVRMDDVKRRRTQLDNEMKQDIYRDIETRHKRKTIDCKTAAMVGQDLDAYGKALDKALMQFHSQQMQNINDWLKENWKSIYKGTDIDEIYIKSEETTQNVAGRRSYNYRVCMKVNNVGSHIA